MIFRRGTPEAKRQKEFARKCRQATLEVIERGSAADKENNSSRMTSASWPYETIRSTADGCSNRLRASVVYWGALISVVLGIVLIVNEVLAGGFLVLTLAPCLLLYPLIRFLFGGKDSVAAAVTTVIVEELLKSEITKTIEKRSKKRR